MGLDLPDFFKNWILDFSLVFHGRNRPKLAAWKENIFQIAH
jgi:hypothetical protein